MRHLDDDEKGMSTIQTLGGSQRVSTVNESGMYALVLRSRKQEAKIFRKWVTSEVLPTIRKTGAYIDIILEKVKSEIWYDTKDNF